MIGAMIEIEGIRGIVAEVGLTTARVEFSDHTWARVPNSELIVLLSARGYLVAGLGAEAFDAGWPAMASYLED